MARIERQDIRFAARAFSIVAVLAAWEIGARSNIVSEFLLPSLSTVLERLWHDLADGEIVSDIGLTLYRALAGFFLAAVVGITAGMLIARNRIVRWFFDPLISIGNPLPKITFLPLFVLWFGIFDLSKILMVSFSAVFPIIVATWAATEGVDKILIWSAQSLGAKRRELFSEIILPSTLPEIFTGLQVALPISLIVVIVCEMTSGGGGLGGSMISAMRYADSPGVFARIVAIAVVGFVLVKTMELIRRRLLAWHPETAIA